MQTHLFSDTKLLPLPDPLPQGERVHPEGAHPEGDFITSPSLDRFGKLTTSGRG